MFRQERDLTCGRRDCDDAKFRCHCEGEDTERRGQIVSCHGRHQCRNTSSHCNRTSRTQAKLCNVRGVSISRYHENITVFVLQENHSKHQRLNVHSNTGTTITIWPRTTFDG